MQDFNLANPKPHGGDTWITALAHKFEFCSRTFSEALLTNSPCGKPPVAFLLSLREAGEHTSLLA